MTGFTDDDHRLAARLFNHQGVHPAALMISRFDAEAALILAREIGRAMERSDRVGRRHCRVCGCTDLMACRPEPCHWVEPDLCSACAEFAPEAP